MKELTIVIPTHQRPQSLSRLLESLTHQKYDPQKYEIIVVFNLHGTESELTLWQDKLPLKSTTVGSLGLNKARQKGIDLSTGRLIMILDDDEEVFDEELFKKHIELHAKFPQVYGISGTCTVKPDLNVFAHAYHLLSMSWMYRYADEQGYSPYLLGGHCSYKREVFFDLGFQFDPRIIFGGTETELNLKLHRQGYQLLFKPELTVLHHIEMNLKSLMRKGFLQGLQGHRRKQTGKRPAKRMKMKHAVKKCEEADGFSRSGEFRVRFAIGLYEWSHRQAQAWSQKNFSQTDLRSLLASWLKISSDYFRPLDLD